jgi:hypothetical protein
MKNVILVSGKLQSGKNAFSDIMFDNVTSMGFSAVNYAFAKPLKENALEDFRLLTEYMNELSDRYNIDELKTEDFNFFENKNKYTRILLQLYGTEIFRKRVNTNYWVDQAVQFINGTNYDYYFITDVRFQNEIEYLNEKLSNASVVTIRVERNIDRTDNINEHESEKALDNYNGFSIYVDNNRDIQTLKESAETVLSILYMDNMFITNSCQET